MADIEAIVSASTFRLRRTEPFFASLLLFANIRSNKDIDTAATDGRTIWFNPDYIASLTHPEVDALILHEVLHCALLHTTRRGGREPILWNIAADIVVNGQIRDCQGLKLPEGAIVDKTLEKFSAEEVYAVLLRKGAKVEEFQITLDLLEPADDVDPATPARLRWKRIGVRHDTTPRPSPGLLLLKKEAKAVFQQIYHANMPCSMRRSSTGVSISGASWYVHRLTSSVMTGGLSGKDFTWTHRRERVWMSGSASIPADRFPPMNWVSSGPRCSLYYAAIPISMPPCFMQMPTFMGHIG